MLRKVAIGLLLLCAAAQAQNVYVRQSGDDPVGVSFTFYLRQAIQNAKGYELLLKRPDKPQPRYVLIDLVTADSWVDGLQLQPPKGSSSYISYVISLEFARDECGPGQQGQIVLHHGLMLSGAARAKESAERLLAEFDKIMNIIANAPTAPAAGAN